MRRWAAAQSVFVSSSARGFRTAPGSTGSISKATRLWSLAASSLRTPERLESTSERDHGRRYRRRSEVLALARLRADAPNAAPRLRATRAGISRRFRRLETHAHSMPKHKLWKRNGVYYAWILGKRVSTGCRDEKAAQREASELERAAVDPKYKAAHETTFGTACQLFKEELELRVKMG